MEHNFRDDLKIDQYALDDVCLQHAELVAEWGLKWADAVFIRDNLKDNLSLIRGECDQEIRETPSKFGWQKPDKAPTESFINSTISTHEKYVTANEKFQTAQHDVNVLMVARDSFEHRDRMIGNLIKLHSNGYWSGNKKIGSGYDNLVSEAASNAQTEGMEKNSRLLKRKVGV